MYNKSAKSQWKFKRIELLFLLVFFLLFPILTDIEYNYWEMHKASLFMKDVEGDLVYGLCNMIAFYVFYKLVQKYLLNERLGYFLIGVVVFLIAYHIYFKLIYYEVGQSVFFSEELRIQAQKLYKSNGLSFSIIYMLIQFLCIAALAYFIHSAKQGEQMRDLKEQQLLLKEQQLMTELNYLKAQVQPHFFFNTLNNIYALALNKSNKTAPLVATLSEMMRYILYETDQKKILLKDEINFLKNYIEVEKVRHQNDITINFDVQGITDEILFDPLLLLPFIENAFKHGIQEITGKGYVNIVICITADELNLQVSNSKPFRNRNFTEYGIGMKNVEKRLELLYPKRYLLDVKDDHDYQVNLTVKIR